MKKLLFLCLITLCLGVACGRGGYYVRDHNSRVMVLPETENGNPPQSYVINGKRFYPLSTADGFTEVGRASWYGGKFHGRPTASGEIYDMHRKTAAHKTLPLGTYVKVTNLRNNKYTIVRVNDRGPFVKGRAIDLSYAAAKDIGLVGPGVVDVKIVALGQEVGELKSADGSKPLVEIRGLEEGEFTIQVGAFQDQNNALRLADRLRVLFDYVRVMIAVDENGELLHRVHASLSKTLTRAEEIEKRLEGMGFTSAFIVRI